MNDILFSIILLSEEQILIFLYAKNILLINVRYFHLINLFFLLASLKYNLYKFFGADNEYCQIELLNFMG